MSSGTAYNSGGNAVALTVQVADASGFALTVAAAATPQVVKDTLFATAKDNTNGGLTFDATTGVVTVAKHHGKGRYRVRATPGNTVGVNAKFHTLQIFAKEGGVAAAAKGIKARKVEPATAVQSSFGACEAIVDLSALSDTVEVRLGVETDGNAVTIRDLSLHVEKIGEVP